MGSSEVDCRPRVLLAELAASWAVGLGKLEALDGQAVVELERCHPPYPGSQCLSCNGCSDYPVAIEWCRRIRRLPDRAVDPHFLETGADLHASGSVEFTFVVGGGRDWYARGYGYIAPTLLRIE